MSVEECVTTLENIRDDINPLEKPTFLEQLKKDLVDGTFKSHHVARLKKSTHFNTAKRDFINGVLQNIASR